MHGIHEAETFPDDGLAQAFLDLRSDVNDLTSFGRFEPQLFAI
jgi:hypothetical protein